jgi:hypothetical protein
MAAVSFRSTTYFSRSNFSNFSLLIGKVQFTRDYTG